jgi:hypothetical protein
MSGRITRRTIIKSALAMTGCRSSGLPLERFLFQLVRFPSSPRWLRAQGRVASYTLRKFSVDDTIRAIQKVGQVR